MQEGVNVNALSFIPSQQHAPVLQQLSVQAMPVNLSILPIRPNTGTQGLVVMQAVQAQ